MGKKKIVEELIKTGKEQGYLTYKEIEKFLVDDILNLDKIEYLYDMLSESGIEIVENDEEGSMLLKENNIEPERLKMAAVCSVCAEPFVKHMKNFQESLKKLRPTQGAD